MYSVMVLTRRSLTQLDLALTVETPLEEESKLGLQLGEELGAPSDAGSPSAD